MISLKENGRYIAAILIFVIGVVYFTLNPSSRSSSANPDQQALYMAQELVKRNLKSPSSASFVNDAIVIPKGGNTYRVEGSVDASNAFGAILRQRYYCTVYYNPSNSNWELKDLLFQ